MKKFILVIGAMVLAVALGSSGALASTINFDGSHSFFLTVLRSSTGTFLSPTSGNITTAFFDYASYLPDEGTTKSTGPTAIVVGTPSSVTATQAAETWLKDRTTTTAYSGPLGDGKFGGTISRNFTAEGPNPDVNLNGIVGQYNERFPPTARTQLLHLAYTIPTGGTGDYVINFRDDYSSTAAVDQETGSVFPVTYFKGFAEMHVKLSGGPSSSDNTLLLYDQTYGALGSTVPIASFIDSNPSGAFTLGPFTYPMIAASTLSLDVFLTAHYDAQTVPLPGTVLLLGSGLLGLLGLRRRVRPEKE